MALGLSLACLAPLRASVLPRTTLWRVEQTCILNRATTGASFPCVDVDLSGGVAILRAPFRQTHVVAMPTVRTVGVEDPRLHDPNVPNYFQAAWRARRFVEAEANRPLAWDDIGLAVNSRMTRSQDQLHIHVDCVRRDVKRELADRLAEFPIDSWMPSGFVQHGQTYWVRRIQAVDFDRSNLFRMADEIPALHAHPSRTILAAIGTSSNGANGFVLLAGQSDPSRMAAQPTSEDLLDHACGGAPRPAG